ncbi:MFS 1 domain containing protein [Trichuris trichiura]|uniref:MFS 1 domain containing protein n=1 Tax=Trichuris trichiura TaxID=36087 RepID=A0A077YY32_TRITR|nr:MFS 1 domain containing protein [Trichuris trichiura]
MAPCEDDVSDANDLTINDSNKTDKKPALNDERCTLPDEELIADALITPPDGGWGWVIVAALFANLLILDGIELSAGQALLPILSDHFSSTPSAVSLIFSLQSSFYYFAGPFSGALVNAFGCRFVALGGALLCATGFFLSTFATSITYLYFTYGVLAGTGMGAIFLCGLSTVSQYFESKRGLATAISLCGAGAGTFIMPPVITLLTEYYHWRQVMLLIAGIQLHNLVFAALYRSLTPTRKQLIEVERRLSKILTAEFNQNTESIEEGKSREQLESTEASDSSLKERDYKTVAKNGHVSPVLHRNMQRALSVTTAPVNRFTGRQLSLNVVRTLWVEFWEFRNAMCLQDLERAKVPDEQELRKLSYASIVTLNRPMNRFDSLYEGAIPDSTSRQSIKGTVPMDRMAESIPRIIQRKRKCFSVVLRNVLRDTFSIRLFASPTYSLFTLCYVLSTIGFFVPFLYLPSQAEMLGSSAEMASFLVSIIGIVNTISRILWGWLVDRPRVDAMQMINCANLVAGTSTVVLPYLNYYPELVVYCVFFGAGIASLISQRSVALLKFVGMKNLTIALGSIMMCMGFACLGGQPLAGYLYEIYGNYNAAFGVSGGLMVVAGFLGFSLNKIYSWELSKTQPADKPLPSSQKNAESSGEAKSGLSLLARLRHMLKMKFSPLLCSMARA